MDPSVSSRICRIAARFGHVRSRIDFWFLAANTRAMLSDLAVSVPDGANLERFGSQARVPFSERCLAIEQLLRAIDLCQGASVLHTSPRT